MSPKHSCTGPGSVVNICCYLVMEAMLMPWVLVPDRDRPAHPVLSIRPQSPCPFLSVLEDRLISRLYRFTEIMSFLDVRANSCHLKGPKYIPKPNRKLFGVVHCLGLSIALSYLRAVS